MVYDNLSFHVQEGTVVEITLLGPKHVFGNGIRVGDSEDRVKAAFGPGYTLRPSQFKDFLEYEGLGVNFEIGKQDRLVQEINIDRDYGDPGLVQDPALAR